MEHSVLCGSEKYPCKEPFVELLKSSLNTFLNAMTFSDKTMYPVASCNQQDFNNLVDVYLDAVFNPLISQDAFLQEGWHYTVDDKDKFGYQGVVFNEMKGVYSKAESYLYLAKIRAFYQGTQYANESGGYPPAIIDLTYQKYLDFYKKYYSPNNSYIYLYGDVDVEFYLDYLDKNYLQKLVDRVNPNLPEIQEVKAWSSPIETKAFYPLAESEKEEKKTYMLWSFLLEKCTDPLHMMSFSILDHILLGHSSAPLRKALMQSELCEDTLNDGFEEDNLQTSFNFGVSGADYQNKEAIEKVIFSTLKKLISDKIDKKSIESAINSFEFKVRENDYGAYPKGLIYAINIMYGWLHEKEPEQFLAYESTLAQLKQSISQGDYFENLIEKYLLKNQSYLVTVCQPDKKFNDKLNSFYEDRLADKKSQISQDDIQVLREDVQRLREKQSKEDDPAVLAKIPTLAKADLEKKIKYSLPNKQFVCNRPSFYTLTQTNNISYFDLAFDSSCLSSDLLIYLPLFSDFYLAVGSKNYDEIELHQKIDSVTGGISLSQTSQTSFDKNEVQLYSLLNIKVMAEKLSSLEELLLELLQNIDFSRKDKILELLKSKRVQLLQYLNEKGESVAIAKLQAQLSAQGKIDEEMGAYKLHQLVDSLVSNFDNKYQDLCDKFDKIKSSLFNQENLYIGVTCSENQKEENNQFLTKIIESLPSKKFEKKLQAPDKSSLDSLAYATQGAVQYVAKGISLENFPSLQKSHFAIVNQLLRTNYLWNNIRVKGGAYGCFVRYSPSQKSYIICSYRDPNLVETLDVYNSIVNYLKELSISDNDFNKLFISVIGGIDKPLTARQQGRSNFLLSLQGETNHNLQKTRDNLFAFKKENLNDLISLFEEFATSGKSVVHGGMSKINENKKIFDEIIEIGSGQ